MPNTSSYNVDPIKITVYFGFILKASNFGVFCFACHV